MIYKVEKYDINENVAYIISDVDALASVELGDKEKKYVHETLETKTFASVNLYWQKPQIGNTMEVKLYRRK